MASLLDRLLGRTEPVAKAQLAEVKAATGPGAYSLEFYPQLSVFSKDKNSLMNEALALYRTQPWVHIAEKTVADRFSRLDWHLEDEDGNTIEEKGEGVSSNELAIAALIERPNRGKTRRAMWSLMSRHLGLAGNHFWYLDQRNLSLAGGSPLQLLPINPVRMTPRFDPSGNLLGWIIDGPDNRVSGSPNRDGTPLDLNEVIHFTLDEPDFGVWGIGVAEAVQTKIELDRLATRHEAQVFASGGRLTGLVSPKAGVEVQPEQWQSLVRDWRNITSDPEAAKRLIVAAAPVDFIQTSSSNEQLQLAELSGQGRDDILNAWGIPLTQIGITKAAGLNSGEKNKNDEAILWQGVIEPRVEAFREKVQFELLDRFATNGGPALQLIIETPEFDDEIPLFDMVLKSAAAAMTNDERRDIVGLGPLDPDIYGELGLAVYVANTMTALFDPTVPPVIQATPVEPVKPLLEAPPPVPQLTTTAIAKAQPLQKPLLGLRSQLQPQWERKVRKALDSFLADQREAIAQNISGRYASLVKKPKDVTLWWNGPRWNRKLNDTLSPLVTDYAATVSRRVTRTVKRPTKANPFSSAVLERVRSKAGERITAINDTTREAVQALVEQGLEEGLGPAELATLISEGTAFNEARAELIARTETALVYNDAALGSYTELGVQEVEAVDGDEDEECAQRDGQVYSVEEAEGIEDHPNGTLDWIPIEPPEPIKAEPITGDAMADGFRAMRTLFESPPPPAPIVNIEPSPPPVVQFDMAPFAKALEALVPKARVVKTVVRDENGRITGVVESSE